MPVWHEKTRALAQAGDLIVIGLVQEQHPERAQLFAAWKEFDFPILWDPFNTTDSNAVPRAFLIDARGVVRVVDARPSDLGPFMAAEQASPPEPTPRPDAATRSLPIPASGEKDAFQRGTREAMDILLWSRQGQVFDEAVTRLVELADRRPGDGRAQFQAGVALRMRYDRRGVGDSTDFQGALDHWAAALELDPNQYIWRRRIQQYGPRLDKPYPFYTWIEAARADLLGRGITPPPLVAALTPAELMLPKRPRDSDAPPTEPDPEGRIQRADGLVLADHAVAFHTGTSDGLAMVHLSLQPVAARDVHWNNSVEPTRIWIDSASLPDGVSLERNLFVAPQPPQETSTETRRFAFEVTLPKDVDATDLRGYALFHICEGSEGRCVYRRLDLDLSIRRP